MRTIADAALRMALIGEPRGFPPAGQRSECWVSRVRDTERSISKLAAYRVNQHLARVIARVHLVIGVRDHAILVD